MNKQPVRRRWNRTALIVAIHTAIFPAYSATVYWDNNGPTPGAGSLFDSVWNTTSATWTPDPTGSVETQAWVNGNNDTAVFSAGSDGGQTFTLGLLGTSGAPGTTAGAIVIKDGNITFGPTGTVGIGSGSVTVGAGAVLSMNMSARISATTGAVFNIQGGTLINTNSGSAGSFVDVDSTITLGPAGGTLSYSTAASLSIIEANVAISGPGTLTKEGPGVLAIASASTYAGGTVINAGELRIRTNANRLPTSGAVTVNAAGILNLNNVSQEIGALTGTGGVGLGGATLTIGGSANSTFSGIIENTRNAGANGTTAINGKVVKKGSGALVLEGVNTYTGSFTISEGTVTVASAGSLCGPTADLIVNGGILNLENTLQIVRDFSGTGGTINLAAGTTLTTDPFGSTTYSGVIAGAGGFEKRNDLAGATNQTLTLSGNNTYAGFTYVAGGTLSITGSLTGTSNIAVAGTLGGTGTITPALNGGIGLIGGGKIAPGTAAGTLTVNLSGSGTIDLRAGIDTSLGALVFDLGTPLASDKVVLNGGKLEIGANLLQFDDFSFTAVAGFGDGGDYVLFDGSSPLSGTLGSALTGSINGLTATLQLANGNSDLILHVVPEPGSSVLILGGLAASVVRRRRASFTISAQTGSI